MQVYTWDMVDFEPPRTVRPAFRGDEKMDPRTGELHKRYPTHKRYKWWAGSMLWILTMLSLVVALLEAANLYQYFYVERKGLLDDEATRSHGYAHLALAGFVHGITINLLNLAYVKLAEKLTLWENYEHQATHEDALAFKVFAFQYANCYAPIFYAIFREKRFDNGA